MSSSAINENRPKDTDTAEKGILNNKGIKSHHGRSGYYFFTKYYAPCLIPDRTFRDFIQKTDVEDVDSIKDELSKIATWIAGDPSLQVYRRFQWLYAICLLNAQETLEKREEELKTLVNSSPNGEPLQNEADRQKTIQKKLKESRRALRNYAELCAEQAQLLSYRSATKSAVRCRKILLWENDANEQESSLALRSQYKSITRDSDLMTLDPSEDTTILRKFVEFLGVSFYPHCLASRLAKSKLGEGKHIPDNLLLFVDAFFSICLTLTFMFAPIALLYFNIHHWSRWHSLGSVIGWAGALCGYMLLVTKTRGRDMLIPLASYCGVLIIFLGLSVDVDK